MKGRCFADIAEFQRELLASLDSICFEDFRWCFQQSVVLGLLHPVTERLIWRGLKFQTCSSVLCSVDRASLYNLVNKTNLVHNLFLVYLPICTCFGWLWAHHQEKQLCFCNTWNLLFCVDNCLVCTLHTRQSSTQNNKYQIAQNHSCFSWQWAHSCPKHVEIDNYTKNKLCTKLVLFARLFEYFKYIL
jgi:hypothetical protein